MNEKLIKEHSSKPSHLPQLSQPYSEIVSGLEDEGITCQATIMRVGQLKPIQNNVNIDKMNNFSDMYSDDDYDLDPIFISEDGNILDGHHRSAGLINKKGKDSKIKTIKLNTDKDNGVRMLNKIQDIYEYTKKQKKDTKKDNKNVLRVPKDQLQEYTKKIIEQNLEEYDIQEDVINEFKSLNDFTRELGNYEELQGLRVYNKEFNTYGFINDDDIEDGYIPSLIWLTKEKNGRHGKYHHVDHLEVVDKGFNEEEVSEGPRTHSSLRQQRLKSYGEKHYAGSRMRPYDRKKYTGSYNLSEDDITEEHVNRYKMLKERWGIKGYPSESLDLEQQEQFMKEYAMPSVPIGGELPALEEKSNIGTGQKLTDYELENYADLTSK